MAEIKILLSDNGEYGVDIDVEGMDEMEDPANASPAEKVASIIYHLFTTRTVPELFDFAQEKECD